MKNKLLVGIGVALAFAACEKNNDDVDNLNNETKQANYYPLEEGSYWVYNTYEIDSLGNEELISENDTVEVIGDSVLNGNTYAKILKKKYAFSADKEIVLRRDSMGYIVNEKGNICFAQDNLSDTIIEEIVGAPEKPYVHWWYIIEAYSDDVNVPAGQFNSILNLKQTIVYLQEIDQPVKYMSNFYAPSVGQLTKQYALSSKLLEENKFYEERLTDYYIATIIE